MRIVSLLKLSPGQIAEIRDVAPGAEVVCVSRSDPAFKSELAQAEIILGSVKIARREEVPKLRWMQLPHAGAEGFVDSPREIIITTGAGVYGIPIAEHLFAMMLALTRGLNVSIRAMAHAAWRQELSFLELDGATVGVIGLGDIGRQFSKRATAFGMRVLAVKRTPGEAPPYVHQLVGLDQLDWVLEQSDHVVISLPGTVHTRHLFSAQRLARIKPGAFIYNVGRGIVIDEIALIQALRTGRIAGAGLDVFETEPLPADSPLWRMPNVIITPHCSGLSPRRDERVVALFLENLSRYMSGKPMRNQFRHELGY